MKNSNSKDKYARNPPTPSDNRLMKTANHTKDPMEKTAYNRPSSGKNLPPKNPQTVQKKQFNIEENMTVSRISEAKQGLQLLKRKMSAKGMSREKQKSNQVKVEKPMTKTSSHKVQDSETTPTRSTMPPKNMTKHLSQNDKTSYSKPSDNKMEKKPQPKHKQPQYFQPQQNDHEMQIPIKPKKDFNALLEEQLRKQSKMGGNSLASKQPYQQPSEHPDEYQDPGQLIQCTQGCGRMFNTKAIVKHEKVCQKVFQSKRKAFDSSAHRAPEVEGFNKPPDVPMKKTQQKKPTQQQQPAKDQKMPKWKAQSLAFRAGLKQGKGAELTKQEKQAMNSGPENDFVQCKFCQRKFNSTAAARHIPFCETKAKQVPKKKK